MSIKSNKNGFTLIELLAVILILGIIALIAIPIVTNIIKEARIKSYEVSAKNFASAIDKKIALNEISGSNLIKDRLYIVNEIMQDKYSLDIKGTLPDDGYVVVEEGSVASYELQYKDYKIVSENGNISTSKGTTTNVRLADYNGNLSVCGTNICNQNGNEIRLTGASMGDFNSSEGEYTSESLKTLANWGANFVRMFVTGKQSYTGQIHYVGQEEQYMTYLTDAIDKAIENNLYVVICWSPNDNTGLASKAIEAFTYLANKYKDVPNIIYEIWNEPYGTFATWEYIKTYANQVIPAIRAIDEDAIIVVGTPNYSSRPDQVINNTLAYDNIMYTYHKYMNDFNEANINYLTSTIDAGIPVFATEWAACNTGQVEGNDTFDEQLGILFANILENYNVSYSYFVYHATHWTYGIVDMGKWDSSLPDSILKENGKFMKKLLSGKKMQQTQYIMAENSQKTSGKYYRDALYKDKIVSLSFDKSINIPKNIAITWDLSFAKDNSIIGYLIPNGNMYDLHIAANGIIRAPKDAASLFANLSKLTSINFENFSSDFVTSMTYMFAYDTNLTSLDLRSLNSNDLNYMFGTFLGCSNLESINFDGWSPKIKGLINAFANCPKLNNLDLSKFDVSNTTDFSSIFNDDSSLSNLNISTWDFSKATTIAYLFINCRNLLNVDISSVDISTITNTSAFKNMNANTTIKVKNQASQEVILNNNTNSWTTSNVIIKTN